MKYIVKRQHLGDRLYAAGEIRDADPNDVGHLVAAGVLSEPDEKADVARANKARRVPKNKASE